MILDILECDFILHDFLDDQFQIGHTVAGDEWTGAVHELLESSLDEGAELELAADFFNDFIAFQCFDHLLSFGVPRGYPAGGIGQVMPMSRGRGEFRPLQPVGRQMVGAIHLSDPYLMFYLRDYL